VIGRRERSLCTRRLQQFRANAKPCIVKVVGCVYSIHGLDISSTQEVASILRLIEHLYKCHPSTSSPIAPAQKAVHVTPETIPRPLLVALLLETLQAFSLVYDWIDVVGVLLRPRTAVRKDNNVTVEPFEFLAFATGSDDAVLLAHLRPSGDCQGSGKLYIKGNVVPGRRA